MNRLTERTTMKTVIFDLDGTLSDSSGGIFRSINYALDKMAAPAISITEVDRYIGPPLRDSFRTLLNTGDDVTLDTAVRFFRDDYTTVGYKINTLYNGIADLLSQLAQRDCQLFIATTKQTDIATEVMRHFDLERYFRGIFGGASEIPKPDLVRHILTEYGCRKETSVMVGDTRYDIHAARINEIFALGVAWGFGEACDIARADMVVDSPGDLLAAIETLIA